MAPKQLLMHQTNGEHIHMALQPNVVLNDELAHHDAFLVEYFSTYLRFVL